MRAVATKYWYDIDDLDRIAGVGPLWLAFARENGAAGLTEKAVLGRPLWDFIAGDAVRNMYRELHRRARETSRPQAASFRCDSPTLQRHMQLRITPGPNGHLKYESILLQVKPQARVAILDPDEPRSRATLTMCSCCKRGLIESRGWLDLDKIQSKGGFALTTHPPRQRHTVCPECLRQNLGASARADAT